MINNFNLSHSNLPYFIAKLNDLDLSKGYVANVKIKASKRSLEQNSWVRKFARDFGEHFGYDADFAYEMLMWKFNPVFKTDPDGNEIRIAGSFSKLTTAEAAKVQDAMLRYGIEHGFIFDENPYSV